MSLKDISKGDKVARETKFGFFEDTVVRTTKTRITTKTGDFKRKDGLSTNNDKYLWNKVHPLTPEFEEKVFHSQRQRTIKDALKSLYETPYEEFDDESIELLSMIANKLKP